MLIPVWLLPILLGLLIESVFLAVVFAVLLVKVNRRYLECLASNSEMLTGFQIEAKQYYDKPLARDCRRLRNEVQDLKRCLDRDWEQIKQLETQLEEAVEAANEAEKKLFEGEAKWFSEVVKADVEQSKGSPVPYSTPPLKDVPHRVDVSGGTQ